VPDTPTALTYGLRELVWGIESEIAVVGSLSRRIDEHVSSLNRLRAELTDRLVALDELRTAAADADLARYLQGATVVVLPTLDEEFPERLYAGD
jgi:hypothetical protein